MPEVSRFFGIIISDEFEKSRHPTVGLVDLNRRPAKPVGGENRGQGGL
jgi:hypothetical protein